MGARQRLRIVLDSAAEGGDPQEQRLMKTKASIAAAVIFFAAGAIAQIWAPQLGLTAMLLGVMSALAAIVLRQQAVLRRLAAHERLITQVQKTAANGKTETATYGASILRRVKQLTDESGAQAGAQHQPPSQAAQGAGAGSNAAAELGAGRASTPEVSNPFTEESLHAMLTPGRRLKVGGVFSQRSLPDGEHVVWAPGQVSESLERQKPEVLLIDEHEIQASPLWSSATTGAGTGLMRELLDGIRWAKAHGVPVYLLPSSLAPDVHSSALRSASVLVLPLDEATLRASAGGPQTTLLRTLHEAAVERAGGAR